jgi:hypothetical protein
LREHGCADEKSEQDGEMFKKVHGCKVYSLRICFANFQRDFINYATQVKKNAFMILILKKGFT